MIRFSLRFGILLVLLFLPASDIYSQQNFITSHTLSEEDIKNYVADWFKKQSPPDAWRSFEIYGIYQKEKEATVFLSTFDGLRYLPHSIQFIKLNSGRWFDPQRSKFLTK